MWNHETVYQALVARGERVKESPSERYVALYPQEPLCAILYAPDSFSSAPLQTNKSRPDWNPELFHRMSAGLEWTSRDNKGPGKEAQNFDHYRVLDWDHVAAALDFNAGGDTSPVPSMTPDEIRAFLNTEFPQLVPEQRHNPPGWSFFYQRRQPGARILTATQQSAMAGTRLLRAISDRHGSICGYFPFNGDQEKLRGMVTEELALYEREFRCK
jgi:hypothetical protein